MCCIFNFMTWVFGFLHKCVTAIFVCIIGYSICCVMLFAIVAGVALGYNYSVSEYMEHKDTNVSVQLMRGIFEERQEDQMRRRSGGGEVDDDAPPGGIPLKDNDETLRDQIKQLDAADDYEKSLQGLTTERNVQSGSNIVEFRTNDVIDKKPDFNEEELQSIKQLLHKFSDSTIEEIKPGFDETMNQGDDNSEDLNPDNRNDQKMNERTTKYDESTLSEVLNEQMPFIYQQPEQGNTLTNKKEDDYLIIPDDENEQTVKDLRKSDRAINYKSKLTKSLVPKFKNKLNSVLYENDSHYAKNNVSQGTNKHSYVRRDKSNHIHMNTKVNDSEMQPFVYPNQETILQNVSTLKDRHASRNKEHRTRNNIGYSEARMKTKSKSKLEKREPHLPKLPANTSGDSQLREDGISIPSSRMDYEDDEDEESNLYKPVRKKRSDGDGNIRQMSVENKTNIVIKHNNITEFNMTLLTSTIANIHTKCNIITHVAK